MAKAVPVTQDDNQEKVMDQSQVVIIAELQAQVAALMEANRVEDAAAITDQIEKMTVKFGLPQAIREPVVTESKQIVTIDGKKVTLTTKVTNF